ncbi:hypothetical protein llap_1562 [Limosa lapponica baueri]|uniref:Uncharacterized protein n=1 Tax=Limosa lapponica baueri TaxID=1758121 RepID=A0A2I0UPX8_LIMLA|nr:hypothetical protein llap_1562 [Limosa lapponica baueri]
MDSELALWRDAGSASPVTARPFDEMGTNMMEDEHCLKPASPEAERDGKAAGSHVGKNSQKVVVGQSPYECLLLSREKLLGCAADLSVQS